MKGTYKAYVGDLCGGCKQGTSVVTTSCKYQQTFSFDEGLTFCPNPKSGLFKAPGILEERPSLKDCPKKAGQQARLRGQL